MREYDRYIIQDIDTGEWIPVSEELYEMLNLLITKEPSDVQENKEC